MHPRKALNSLYTRKEVWDQVWRRQHVWEEVWQNFETLLQACDSLQTGIG